ncbi:MAG: ATP-dependent metallopeptidase FtsH/Yme1/Tma family protein [Planctomycetes bacterium]|nr:ATP-dependent metallopeptidase FtsH/Yme1/Tma family protein [Planctomycetota bacterium]
MSNEPKKPKQNRIPDDPPRSRGFLFFILFFGLLGLMVYLGYNLVGPQPKKITFQELYEQANNGWIKNIVITGSDKVKEAGGEYKDGFPKGEDFKKFSTYPFMEMELDKEILQKLYIAVGKDNIRFDPGNSFWEQILLIMIPWVLIIGVIWYLFFRQIRSADGGGPPGVFSFGKSRARFASREQRKVTFADVAGIEDAREEVGEIIEFLKNPKKFQKIGARIPRGVLLVGPPGTGKTLLAKAIAGEANVPFLSMSGSDFVEMFVGVGASRVRDLFKQAKSNSPCIVFLDEIDAVGRHRGSGLGGGHDEREQTLNAILVEMDGFDTDTSIIIMAATNRPDVLDPALLRPGRFDRQIVLDMPDVKGREAILKVHARKIKLDPSVDLSLLAKTTPMFSGADLEATINEAALMAVMKKRETALMEDLEEARDKVRWGRQKRSRQMAEEDKKITAYHESGHAVVSYVLPEVENVHKVTIIPRGISLGSTMLLPEKDRYHMHKKYVLGNITTLFGGRVAEETFCTDISTGARSDIKQATDMARSMVTEWGMSEKLGPISYTDSEEHLFLGREITRSKPHSEMTAQTIDDEVKSIITSCYNRAREIINANKEVCAKMAQALLKYEVLNTEDVEKIFKGADINTLHDNGTAPAPAKAEPAAPNAPEIKPT